MSGKVITALAASVLSLNAVAQPVWNRLMSSISGKCLEFQYDMSAGGNASSGSVMLQGDAYKLSLGESAEYCDGTTLWYVDGATKEVTIEQATNSDATSSAVDPSLMIAQLDRYFKAVSSANVFENGKSLVRVDFQALRTQGSTPYGISSLRIWFKDSPASSVIVKAVMTAKDGQTMTFRIPSMSVSAPLPKSSFVFDTKGLKPGWTVNDLR